MSSYAWIVVADSARARIFSVDGATAPLAPIDHLLHPESRLHDRDLRSDRPGRSFDSEGEGRHSTGTPVSPKQQESLRFAKTVADHLEQGRLDGSYDHLNIVADPRFLGALRDAVSTEVEKLVSLELNKDLSKVADEEIRRHLPDEL